MTHLPQDELIRHDVEQGTDAWLSLRQKYRTGSDTASVLGISPYLSRAQFLKERVTGERAPVSDFVKSMRDFGSRHESAARRGYMTETGLLVQPAVFTRGRYIASMDGVCEDGGTILRGVEIKVPARGARSARWLAAQNGQILEHDKTQLAVQFAVLRCPIDFWVYLPAEEDMFGEASPARAVMLTYSGPTKEEWEAIEKAWDEFEAEVAKGALAEGRYDERPDMEWALAAEEFLSVKVEADMVNARLESARARLIDLANGKDCAGAGVRVAYVKRAGATDWKAAFQSVAPKGFDLKPFKKEDKVIVTVSSV